jgi:TRAP transporter TAXI family solute receptor
MMNQKAKKKFSLKFTIVMLATLFLLIPLYAGKALSETKFITISTAGVGGFYYPLGSAVAQVLNNKGGMKANVQTSGGSVENVRLLHAKKVEMGFAPQDVLYDAWHGEGAFNEKIQDIRFLFAIAGKNYVIRHGYQLVVPEDSPIQKFTDIKGKRVCLGPAGSGTETKGRRILKAYGLSNKDIKQVYLSYTEAAQAIRNRSLDAAGFFSSMPTAAVNELTLQMKVRFIPIESDIAKNLENYGCKPQWITPKMYSTLKEKVPTIHFGNHAVIVNQGMDNDTAYKITKLLFQNKETVERSNKGARGYDETGIEAVPLTPLHPGAVKYYKEKGVKIPARLIK